jgi:hypothetical protein
VDVAVRSGVVVTEVTKEGRCVQLIVEETGEHGILLDGRDACLGGPGRVGTPYPAKVVPAERGVGDSEVEDQRVSCQ